MRTSLDHLPAAKKRELERVVQILFEELATYLQALFSKGQARILKVIFYGSYALRAGSPRATYRAGEGMLPQ